MHIITKHVKHGTKDMYVLGSNNLVLIFDGGSRLADQTASRV